MAIYALHTLLCAALLWGCGSDAPVPPPAPVSGLDDLIDHTTFADQGLERAVRLALATPRGPLVEADLLSLEALDASQQAIDNLSGIERLAGLRRLILGANNLVDLAALADLKALQFLDLSDNRIDDLAALVGLNRLSALDLSGNQVADLQPLADLDQLTHLGLDDNLIRDVSPLANLRRLRLLNLDNNLIRDISALMGLRLLRDLELSGNPLIDLDDVEALEDRGVQVRYYVPFDNPFDIVLEAAIRKELDHLKGPITKDALESLNFLSLTGPIQTLSGIDRLSNLSTLFVRYTGGDSSPILNDLTPIIQLRKLTSLTVRETSLSDLVPIGTLVLLEDLGLPSNAISDLSPLASLTRLAFLNIASNEIVDLTPLKGLSRLSTINMTNCQVTDLSPLLEMANLKQVWVRGNPLSGESLNEIVPILRDRGTFVVGL
jgi:internalin A